METSPSKCCWLFLAFASLLWTYTAETSASVASHDSPVGSWKEEERRNLSVLIVSSLYIAHQFPLLALGEELVRRGHRVAMLGPVVEGVPTLPDLPLSKGMEFYDGGAISESEHRAVMSGLRNLSGFFMFLYNMSRTLNQSHAHLVAMRKAVDRLDGGEWDFVVADNTAVTILHYIMREWHTDRVLMNFSPLPVLAPFAPPWTFPRGLTGFPEDMNFKERFLNALLTAVETACMPLVPLLAVAEEKQRTDLDVVASAGHIYPVLINTVIGFDYPRTILPLAHFVGPMLSSDPTPLSPDLQRWLSGHPEGSVVYIGMGTSAELSGQMAREILEGIVDRYAIVWSLRKSNQGILSDLSIDLERVFVSGWVSQLALLQHPAMAMSITHCAASVQESLYYGKPVVCVPYGADQFDIAVRVKTQGYGIRILAQELTGGRMASAMAAIETGPYRTNARRLAKIFRVAGGAQKAADLVEFYAEVGPQHGVPAYIKYGWSWVQYYNADVMAVNAVLLAAVGWAATKLLRCCCRCCCRCCWQQGSKTKVKTN